MVVNLCKQFHCLPSQLEEESVELIKLINIVAMGAPDDPAEGEEESWLHE